MNKSSLSGEVRICLVDDNEEYLKALCRPLSKKYAVRSFTSAGEFLSQFENGIQADVVCLDYKIPDMNGIELCRAIKQKDNLLPVVLISGWIDKKVAMDALAVGISEIVEKPCTLDVFLETIHRASQHRKQHNFHKKLLEGYRELVALYRKLVKECEHRYISAENKLLGLDPMALSGQQTATEYMQSVSSTSALHREIEKLHFSLDQAEGESRLSSGLSASSAAEESSIPSQRYNVEKI